MKILHIILHIVESKAIFSYNFFNSNVVSYIYSVTNCFPVSKVCKKHSFEKAKTTVNAKKKKVIAR